MTLIKYKFTLIFKSGGIQEIEERFDEETVNQLNDFVHKAFEESAGGVLNFEDENKKRLIVRIEDLSMVEVERIE